MIIRQLAAVAAATVLAVGSLTASAAVITFDPLTGSNGDVYTGHSEAGFDVSVDSGAWREAHAFGNPVPAIYGLSDTGVIAVELAGGGTFTFDSVDLADAGTGGATFSIEGFLGAASQFVQTGAPLPGTFETINSAFVGVLDRLEITMHRNAVSYNIDNIVVNAAVASVTAPGTMVLGFIALAGLAAVRRRDRV